MATGLKDELLLLLLAGVMLVLAALACCRLCLSRRLERMRSLWDDIYFRLRERCHLVGELSKQLRKQLGGNPKLADDIDYLIRRMEETNDPQRHAAVQNGLVLTVQTAVEQFHRTPTLQLDSGITRTMQEIAVVDSRLAPMRDRLNEAARVYNKLLNTVPFSWVARLMKAEERSLFRMLIPWWSMDPAAYGVVSASEIMLRLQSERAPLILAPSQRTEWSGGRRVIRVRDQLRGGRDTAPDTSSPGRCATDPNGRREE